MPSITHLTRLGDVTFTWDEANEEQLIAYIEAKMKKGYTFFLIEKDSELGIVLTPTTDLDAIKAAKRVRMSDEDEELLAQGNAKLARPPVNTVERVGPPIKDPKVIAKSDTVAIKRIVGG